MRRNGGSDVAVCEGCGVLIGPDYASRDAYPALDRVGVVCRACKAGLERLAARGEDALAVLGWWRRSWHRARA